MRHTRRRHAHRVVQPVAAFDAAAWACNRRLEQATPCGKLRGGELLTTVLLSDARVVANMNTRLEEAVRRLERSNQRLLEDLEAAERAKQKLLAANQRAKEALTQ